ncbi:uncharacterized protein [Takifugu rubripes]|uniref:Uncharacterized LOC115246692 n=1 Tax=Takifugu rubripes TaxID=31033 RepID=A0A3B5KQN0_TAKRU|nr:uncharacterized protein LOC115246692 [Takifugu rubripes]
MNSFKISLIVVVLWPQVVAAQPDPSLSFEAFDDISFSLCWMSKGDVLDRENASVWLNGVALTSVRKLGKVISLTVSPGVENTLTLQYRGSAQSWTLKITPGTTLTKVRGDQKPQQQPLSDTKGFQDILSPDEAFACENGTLFFHQDENFFLAFGYTARLAVVLQFSSSSMLMVSWTEKDETVSRTTLYQSELDSYTNLGMDTTTNNHYSFTALESCSSYVVCVEIAGTQSFTCLAAVTDPDIPQDLKVLSWNGTTISLVWAPPENKKYSLFLVSAFYLNGTDHVTEEVHLWHTEESLVFVLSDLHPCSRVRFGLQTVCEKGIESQYSEMVHNDGNSLYSSVEALCQTSYGPNNYTLTWEVRNTSSISKFRVYHEGALQGTTHFTNYTVDGLLPCQEYQAKVEALCGDDVVMNVQTVATHTGLHGVSDLKYRSNDSTAMWVSSGEHPGIAFLYELSLLNGTTLHKSQVTDTEVHLPGLDDSKSYLLDVWEQCEGQWESERAQLCIEGANSSLMMFLRAVGPILDQELQLNFSRFGLTVVVPWSLPQDLQDNASEPRHTMKEIIREKLQSLLQGFKQSVHVEVSSVEPAAHPNKTEIVFMTFDVSQTEHLLLPAAEQLKYIRLRNESNIKITDSSIYWDIPDLCASSKHALCPPNSLCVNTLGYYTCVCQHGYYDVRFFMQPQVLQHPVCNEKGLFSQCLHNMVAGGIAKAYLMSRLGGKVDVKLNEGQCKVQEQDMFYYFRTSQKTSKCGTKRQVNRTHIEFQNMLSVSLRKTKIIRRRDFKIIWKCVYPRHYTRNTGVSVGTDWLSTLSLVEFSSSLQLGLIMTLYTNDSYMHQYTSVVQLESEDVLFFQVALQTNNTFASDVLLQVDSCWATESRHPDDAVQGILLQDGCPIDETFQWLSVNGGAQRSRFSVEMFTMPQGLPLYIHCLANICGPDEECSKDCSSHSRAKRSVLHANGRRKLGAVVSAGPVLVNARVQESTSSFWTEHMRMIFTVAGLIGFLIVTVLSVTASKAIMTYYERLRLKVFYQ